MTRRQVYENLVDSVIEDHRNEWANDEVFYVQMKADMMEEFDKASG